jgi:hypothetical protein
MKDLSKFTIRYDEYDNKPTDFPRYVNFRYYGVDGFDSATPASIELPKLLDLLINEIRERDTQIKDLSKHLIDLVMDEFYFEKRTPETFDQIKARICEYGISVSFIRPDPTDTGKIYINTILSNGTPYEYHGPASFQ